MHLRRHLNSRRRGTAAVMVAVSLVAILAVVSLTLDGGSLFEQRRQAQAVADAAALAAAADLFDYYWTNSGEDPSGSAKASAMTLAKENSYDNDGVTNTVTVLIPPTSGPHNGKRGYVEVLVEYHFTRTFSSIFSATPVTVRTRAVAIGLPVAADVGILVLDPHKRSAFNAQGSGATVVKGTPVIVNSDDPEGSIAGGGGSVQSDKFVFTGGWGTSGGGTFVGPIYTGKPPTVDPLKDLTPPDPYTMPIQSHKQSHYTSGSITLEPGVYKKGISVSGTASLNLKPGVYYMDGGGFAFSGQGSLFGKDVMIYTNPGNGNSDNISVSGQGSLVLSGREGGPYQGITFWQRRDATVTGHVEGAGGATNITGTFYFAGALLEIKGNGGVANIGSQYISNELNLGGNGGINVDWRPEFVARKRAIHLVE